MLWARLPCFYDGVGYRGMRGAVCGAWGRGQGGWALACCGPSALLLGSAGVFTAILSPGRYRPSWASSRAALYCEWQGGSGDRSRLAGATIRVDTSRMCGPYSWYQGWEGRRWRWLEVGLGLTHEYICACVGGSQGLQIGRCRAHAQVRVQG